MSTEPASGSDVHRTAPEGMPGGGPSLQPGEVLAGRYVVDRMIGEGGMGEVYLARHQKIGKLVAIKLLAAEQTRRARTVSRFLQEAKATSKIRHENIVDITDFGEDEGRAFFVMEYLEGEDLSFLVKREGRLEWPRARAILVQILKGLGAAHAVGVLHRDIKPHNCFISAREGNPEFVKVIDFGIAKISDGSEEQLTRTGAIMGTAEYMSPEQGQGAALDGRSDLYSAGIILYRMLVGRVPFRAGNTMATLYQHVNEPPTPPSEACPEAGFGPHIDALVGKALAKDPDDRFATTEEFIDALQTIDDATAPATKASERGWTTPLIAGLTLAAAVVVGAVVWGSPDDDPSAETRTQGAAIAAVPPPSPTPGTSPVGEPAPVEVRAPAKDPEPASADPPAPDEAVDNVPETPTGAEPPASDPANAPTADQDPTAQVSSPAPARRSQRQLTAAFEKLRGRVTACGKKAGLFPGERLSVSVSLKPDGRASKVTVSGTHAAEGVKCVTKAVKRAQFGPAQRSQSASHAFTI